jgi:hypothetical protein
VISAIKTETTYIYYINIAISVLGAQLVQIGVCVGDQISPPFDEATPSFLPSAPKHKKQIYLLRSIRDPSYNEYIRKPALGAAHLACRACPTARQSASETTVSLRMLHNKKWIKIVDKYQKEEKFRFSEVRIPCATMKTSVCGVSTLE